MIWSQIAANWEQFREKVKEKWDHITDDDLSAIDDKRQQLLDLLQVRYGYDKARAEKELTELVRTLKPTASADTEPMGMPDNLAGPRAV